MAVNKFPPHMDIIAQPSTQPNPPLVFLLTFHRKATEYECNASIYELTDFPSRDSPQHTTSFTIRIGSIWSASSSIMQHIMDYYPSLTLYDIIESNIYAFDPKRL